MIDFNANPLFLAPLAGYSDIALRGVVKKFCCDVTTSEMISANALALCNKKTLKMLEKNSSETPYIVQIMGGDEEMIKRAVLLLNEIDGIDGIDLNCGCPVPKVVKQGAGSALLLNYDKLKKVVETIKRYSNKRYTSVKVRLGFDKKEPDKIIEALNEFELSYICMHARTRSGGYSSKVDYECIKIAKELCKTKLIANGDIDKSNAAYVKEYTKADGLMIGRASIGQPWIFYEIKNGKNVSKELKNKIILYHYDEMLKYYGKSAVAIFRKHLHRYSKGLEGAALFRDEINKIQDEKSLREAINSFFSSANLATVTSHEKGKKYSHFLP